MDLTVIVATYGDLDFWDPLAARAVASIAGQAPVVRIHGDTLHDARNAGAAEASTDWLCFLDADDELEGGYLEAMAEGSATVRAPSVRYVRPAGRPPRPVMPRVAGHRHACTADCLDQGNWLVIGSIVPRDLFLEVGGFRDFTWSEDWDLWVRCWQAGATFEPIPDAVYRAHVRPDSRNRAPDRAARHAAHQAIARANGLSA